MKARVTNWYWAYRRLFYGQLTPRLFAACFVVFWAVFVWVIVSVAFQEHDALGVLAVFVAPPAVAAFVVASALSSQALMGSNRVAARLRAKALAHEETVREKSQ